MRQRRRVVDIARLATALAQQLHEQQAAAIVSQPLLIERRAGFVIYLTTATTQRTDLREQLAFVRQRNGDFGRAARVNAELGLELLVPLARPQTGNAPVAAQIKDKSEDEADAEQPDQQTPPADLRPSRRTGHRPRRGIGADRIAERVANIFHHAKVPGDL